jgi:hypothetical protein
MKKRNLFLVAALVLSFFIANAQNTEQGDKILNLGVGFGNNYTAGGSDFSNSIPPLSASFEYIIKGDLFGDGKGAFGVGAFAQYMNYNYEATSYPDIGGGTIEVFALKSAMISTTVDDWKYNQFVFGPRGYLHYSFIDKLDTYTGLMLGLDYISWGRGSSDYTHTDFAWGWFIGGRYYFTDNLAAMLELGYSATYVNIGVAYKFGN